MYALLGKSLCHFSTFEWKEEDLFMFILQPLLLTWFIAWGCELIEVWSRRGHLERGGAACATKHTRKCFYGAQFIVSCGPCSGTASPDFGPEVAIWARGTFLVHCGWQGLGAEVNPKKMIFLVCPSLKHLLPASYGWNLVSWTSGTVIAFFNGDLIELFP